jgi:hypothetical protein
VPPDLYGPLGLLIGLSVAVAALWRADADDRTQRDAALAGWRDQTAATTRLADAIEQSNRDATQRHRRDDGT